MAVVVDLALRANMAATDCLVRARLLGHAWRASSSSLCTHLLARTCVALVPPGRPRLTSHWADPDLYVRF